jgi:hypothetical protein
MGTTIDKYDNKWYRRRARSIFETETFFEDMKVGGFEEIEIPPHIEVDIDIAQVDTVDELVGKRRKAKKAFFTEPEYKPRKSVFGFDSLASSLGSERKVEADIEKMSRLRVSGLEKIRFLALLKGLDRRESLTRLLRYCRGEQLRYRKG